MKVYKYEINDGISEIVNDKNSIAFDCHILEENKFIPDTEQTSQSFAFIGTEQEKQKDLYYLNSVLVSAGWNKNDDVFGVGDLWEARHTPVNKQFNFMHDDSDIIGHIVGSMVADHEGNKIDDQSALESLPENIDIITSAVIYKMWSDPGMRERIEELTKEIDDGKWSVSMECIFSNFDYAIVGPDGEQRVLSRTEESAFLTKHLRAYGGSGNYSGYKVGRLLKGFYFSGKGLVAKPANPRSIILNKELNPFNTKASDISLSNFLTAMEIHNMNENAKQIEDLKSELESAKANFEAEKSTIDNQYVEKLMEVAIANELLLSNKDQSITSLQEKVKELEDSISAMLSDKAQIQQNADAALVNLNQKEEEIEAVKGQYAALAKEIRSMRRCASLCEIGISTESARKIISDFAEASDEMFDSVVALIAQSAMLKPVVESVEATQTAAPIDFGSDEGDDEDEDEAADASQLEKVEEVAEATLANPESEEENHNTAIASAANWLRASVLKSTKNLNK